MIEFFKKHLRYRKLQFHITTLFIFLLLATLLSLMYYTYKKNKETLVEFSSALMQQVSKETVNHITNLANVIEISTEIAQAFVSSEDSVSLKNKALVDYLRNALKQHEFMDTLRVANINGDSVGVFKVKKRDYFIQNDLKKTLNEDQYIIFYSIKEKPSELIFIVGDNQGDKNKHLIINYEFETKTRLWFEGVIKTKKEYWTDIYLSTILKSYAISFGFPIFDQNNELIAISQSTIYTTYLSEFLKKNKITNYSSMMLLDDNGIVIADSDENFSEFFDQNKFVKISEKNPIVAAGYEIFFKNKQPYFLYNYEGIEYLASFTPYKFLSGKNWTLSVVIPASYFLDQVIETQKKLYFIAISIILLGILLVGLFSRQISKPIVMLAESLTKIRQLDLDEKLPIKSRIKEVVLMKNAVDALKSALKSFKKYVPEEIVKFSLAKGKEIKLGGTEQELTLFFSDIYDFTAITDTYPIDIINSQLAIYYETLSDIIINQKGTIDKYIGDGIMAFWGAPIELKNHTEYALRAALICKIALNKLNTKWQKEGRPEFKTRIGIHTDEVIIGNIGTSTRMNYTVMGDGVNLASRLEGINKNYHTSIVVSLDVKQKCDSQFLFRPIDFVKVKGKREILKIYEPLGELKGPSPLEVTQEEIAFVNEFEVAFNIFFEGKKEEALKRFEKLLIDHPNDFLIQMYIERCKQ